MKHLLTHAALAHCLSHSFGRDSKRSQGCCEPAALITDQFNAQGINKHKVSHSTRSLMCCRLGRYPQAFMWSAKAWGHTSLQEQPGVQKALSCCTRLRCAYRSEGWNLQPDKVPIIAGCDAQVGCNNGALNFRQGGFVIGLHHQHGGLGDRDPRKLLQGGGGTIVVHLQ